MVFIWFACVCQLPRLLASYEQTESLLCPSLHFSVMPALQLVGCEPPVVKLHYQFRNHDDKWKASSVATGDCLQIRRTSFHIILLIKYIFCIWMFCLHTYMCATSMPGSHIGQLGALDPLEWELQNVMSHHMGTKQTPVPCKSSKYSQLLGHLSGPNVCLFYITSLDFLEIFLSCMDDSCACRRKDK